ncbi:MAG: hypothetical protein AABO41_26265 [Acidobacteriota bacterium]
MSSTLYMINWCPNKVTATLNTKQLSPIDPSLSKDYYFPDSLAVPRDASVPGKAGVWGNDNALIVLVDGANKLYNSIKDPSGAAPNNDLLLWIFTDFVVFSQFDNQLGSPVHPS